MEIQWASIEELQSALREKRVTCREIIFACAQRVADIDSGAEGLHSVLEINPDALAIADELDARLAAGEEMPPLFGVPVLLKDNIATGDRMVTSAGSLSLADNFAPEDADIATRLRQAGAVLLGKANMTEFANYMATDMANGYSSRGGQTVCPHGQEKDPSGSSSGSAVAVAAGICPVSVGTETSGSIMSPATANGVVGIKPTGGLLSGRGIVPISSTLDTAGPMARSVCDAALLLAALSGKNELGVLDACDLSTVRIGLNRIDQGTLDQEALDANEALLEKLRQSGVTLVPVEVLRTERILSIMEYEFKRCMNAFLATMRPEGKIKTLRDIILFNELHPEACLRYGQARLLDAQHKATGSLIEREYWDVMAEREAAIHALDDLFSAQALDAILCVGPTNIAPFTGFPSITLPIGRKADGAPVGMYMMARRYDERTLLSIAAAVETLLGLDARPVAQR